MDDEIEKNLNEILTAYVQFAEEKRSKPEGKEGSSITENIGRDVLDEATTKK